MKIKRLVLILLLLAAFALSGCGLVRQPEVLETDAAPSISPSWESGKSAAPQTSIPSPEPSIEVTVPPEPEDTDFVRVADYIPDIVVDLKYAAEDNFTGEVIYDFTDAWLRYGTVKKLMEVQKELSEYGLGLKIWDAFRPVSAQFTLWSIVPDSRYVANPNSGYSSHSRGNTIDLTLIGLDDFEVEMPTGFDDFSLRADRDYSDVSEAAAENSRLLEAAMTRAGFVPYSAEWWHYSDTVWYEVDTSFSP